MFGTSKTTSWGEQLLPPRHVWRSRIAVMFAVFLASLPVFAGPPGAVISNQASLDYTNLAGSTTTLDSNQVSVVTGVIRSPAVVEFARVVAAGTWQETVGPSACFQGGAFVNLGNPTLLGGNVIDPTTPQEIAASSAFNIGESAFLRLVDADQNLDYQLVEYVEVVFQSASGDSERIRLSETGADTGVFSGYVPLGSGAIVPADCVLQGTQASSIRVDYVDPADANDIASATAELDPVQRVFESRTGTVVDGATVEIVDATSGLPAMVFGNDGVSQFPSAIVSGGTATDSGGTSYVFGPGEYRFPVVPDGDYRLVVTPPAAYSAPSSAEIADLQNLPGAPYLLSPASFGAQFTKSGALSTAVDIPLDPLSSALFLQKQTLTSTAAPGDFVRYELSLENASGGGIATGVTIVDQLPPGVRFVPGSVMIDDVAVADPVVAADLSTLEFSVPDIPVGARTRIYYVVEIVGGARGEELVNSATAFAAGGLLSNESRAAILLTEDLFRSTSTIIGRIIEGDCSAETFTEEQGVADIRVYLEDGRYAVSDAGGRFHFEGVEPGTHVVQMDTFTVPEYFDLVGCAQTPGFAGSREAQFVKAAPGGLHRTDFYLLRKEPPTGQIDIEMRNSGTDSTEQVAYDLTLNGTGNVDIENISLMVVLPAGVSYSPGTMRMDGARVSEPHIVGPSVSLAVDPQYGNWTKHVRFIADIEPDVDGELVTKAVAKFDTPMQAKQRTPIVETRMVREPAIVRNEDYVLDLKFAVLSDELSPEDKLQLDMLVEDWQGVSNSRIVATGHSDSQPISERNRHRFADNYVLSQARAMSAAFYIANALGLDSDAVQVVGRGPDEPVASNATADGRRKNRRVELIMTGIRPTRPSFLEVTRESSGTLETATTGAIPGMERDRAPKERVDIQVGMPSSQKEPSIESLSPGYAMLLPTSGYAPAIASTKVAIQHEPGQTVDLTLNDKAVSRLNLDSSTTNAAGTIAVTRWAGVDLVDGANELRAVIWNSDGSKASSVRRTIHFTGTPIRAEIDMQNSVLIADGKTMPVVAVRLFDRSGEPARAGIVGDFRVEAPYRSAWDEQNDRKNALVEVSDRSASYRVDADGIAHLELAPTTRTGEVTVVLPFGNYREQEVRAWLKPAQRDWILVGFAEGTAAHATLSDNISAATAAGFEDGYYDEGRVAFFAKGSIKGEYLLTVAFDSDRDRDAARDRFNTVVDPNAYYTLYADQAEQRFEAASQRKIYVKLERNQFYALFGDYDTGFSVTDLARYQRRFNGLKTEYRGENVGFNAFAAETDQTFNRDELRGDGTSGLYQLSGSPIIANSESIRIETRDRFDSGVVLSSRNLIRFVDYTLDTLSGTLYFKQPIPSRDLDFNPVYIVAEYEAVAAGSEDIVAGARASLRSADDRVEVGVTYINDATAGAEADMTGIDLRWQVSEQTLLKAEVADSNASSLSGDQEGSAHKIELEHNGENVDFRAYIREVEEGFGLGYQSAADSGVRRLGFDARAKVSERFSVEAEGGWQQTLGSEDIRNIARALLRYENNGFNARLGLSHAVDKFDDGDKRSSQLVEAGISRKVFDDRLRLRASASVAANNTAESLDYPERYVIGADYRVLDGVEIVAEYEDASGQNLDASAARVGIRATPWTRGQINSFVTNEVGEFGPRLFANVGLIQGFQLNENWTLDVGVDHAETLVDNNARQFDPDRELTTGSLNEDFHSAFFGATYNSELWSANSRIETRNSDSEDRVSLLAGWYRQPTEGHGLSAGLTVFQSERASGGDMAQANLRFGWAYRKANSRWSFLNRTDLVLDELDSVATNEKSWRFINNFNANRRISAASQLSLQYAFKYVRSNFDTQSFTGYSDLLGIDFRHGFRDRWDAGISTSIYNAYNSGVMDYGVGVDVGYNVGRNMWLTLGYNFEGFDDDDFAAARYTAAGPFLRFSFKADQHLLKRIAGQNP